jgi:peroxiredoxin
MGSMLMSAKLALRKAFLIAVVGTFVVDQPIPMRAAKFNRRVDVGLAAPAWKGLARTDGKKRSLVDYRAAKILVIAFTSNSCPVSQLYEDRLIRFANEQKPHGVAFVAINCSLLDTDSLDKMGGRAREKHFNFDCLSDPSQQTGRGYGATVTPQFFVLDQERKIAYMGKFDDNIEPEKVQHKYVENAVEALLAGQRPEPSETRATGCGIEYGKPQ